MQRKILNKLKYDEYESVCLAFERGEITPEEFNKQVASWMTLPNHEFVYMINIRGNSLGYAENSGNYNIMDVLIELTDEQHCNLKDTSTEEAFLEALADVDVIDNQGVYDYFFSFMAHYSTARHLDDDELELYFSSISQSLEPLCMKYYANDYGMVSLTIMRGPRYIIDSYTNKLDYYPARFMRF